MLSDLGVYKGQGAPHAQSTNICRRIRQAWLILAVHPKPWSHETAIGMHLAGNHVTEICLWIKMPWTGLGLLVSNNDNPSYSWHIDIISYMPVWLLWAFSSFLSIVDHPGIDRETQSRRNLARVNGPLKDKNLGVLMGPILLSLLAIILRIDI